MAFFLGKPVFIEVIDQIPWKNFKTNFWSFDFFQIKYNLNVSRITTKVSFVYGYTIN